MKKVLNDLIGYLSENVSESDIIAAEQLARISVIIATERIKRGMTQAEFAEYMGVSQSMVSKWESEDYNYSIESLASICVKLGLDFVVECRAAN